MPAPRQQQPHSTYMGQFPTIPAGYRAGLHPPRPPQAHGFPMHMGGHGQQHSQVQPHFQGHGHPAHQQMPQVHSQHPQGHPQHPQGHPQYPQGHPQAPQAHHPQGPHPQGPGHLAGPRGLAGIPPAHSMPSHHPQHQQQQQQQAKLRNITNSIDLHKQGKQSQQQKAGLPGQLVRPPPPGYYPQQPWPQYVGHDPSDSGKFSPMLKQKTKQ